MKENLSSRQRDILKFIQDFMEERHYPPTVRDIQTGCDVSSTSVVDYNLHKLQALGYLKREPEVSRGIELIGEGLKGTRRDIQNIPIMGSIAAGEPLNVPDAPAFAGESYETVDLPASLVGERENMFALRVKGTSMVDALVGDGDLVIMEPASEARDGDMVAAWLGGSEGTTLKRFYSEGNVVRLQPENAAMAPIRVDAEDVSVRGRVIGIYRSI